MSRGLARRPVLGAILGALVIAFSAILVDLANVSPAAAAVYRCAYALPALGALAWWEDRRHGRRSWRERRFALAAGTFFAADLITWHHAIADVGAGLATVLGNLQVVIVPFLALAVLREPVPRRILRALPLVCAGVVLVSGALTRHGACCSARSPGLPTRRFCSSSATAAATCAGRRGRCST
jgi:drug/metabolite transporter (DMT)-like permease